MVFSQHFVKLHAMMVARDGAVGIALRAGRSEDQNAVEARFSSRPVGGLTHPPVQWAPGLFPGGNEAVGYVTRLSYIG
jgi:hypothetical protein